MSGDRTRIVHGRYAWEYASDDPEHRGRQIFEGWLSLWLQRITRQAHHPLFLDQRAANRLISKIAATVTKRLRSALGPRLRLALGPPQPTPPLLQLPGEVRNMIYAYVFSDIEWSAVMCYARIHNNDPRDFINRKTYWGWMRLLISKWYPTDQRAYYRYVPKYSNLHLHSYPSINPYITSSYYRALALTQTCRQVRAESRLLPYKTASYTKVDTYAFSNWLIELDVDTRLVVLAGAQR
jgi:hypothetical protein